jgi:hypothetical protein
MNYFELRRRRSLSVRLVYECGGTEGRRSDLRSDLAEEGGEGRYRRWNWGAAARFADPGGGGERGEREVSTGREGGGVWWGEVGVEGYGHTRCLPEILLREKIIYRFCPGIQGSRSHSGQRLTRISNKKQRTR